MSSTSVICKSGAFFEVVPDDVPRPTSPVTKLRARSNLEGLTKEKRWSFPGNAGIARTSETSTRSSGSESSGRSDRKGFFSRALGMIHKLRHPSSVRPLEQQFTKISAEKLRNHLMEARGTRRKERNSAPGKLGGRGSTMSRLEIIAEDAETSEIMSLSQANDVVPQQAPRAYTAPLEMTCTLPSEISQDLAEGSS